MKRLTILIALIAILAGLLSLRVADTKASITNTSIPDNEIASSANQTDSPLSANATITISMRTAPLPETSVDLESQSKGG